VKKARKDWGVVAGTVESSRSEPEIDSPHGLESAVFNTDLVPAVIGSALGLFCYSCYGSPAGHQVRAATVTTVVKR